MMMTTSPRNGETPAFAGVSVEWAIQDSNLGPLPYQGPGTVQACHAESQRGPSELKNLARDGAAGPVATGQTPPERHQQAGAQALEVVEAWAATPGGDGT
jgi:hypothetical protein